MGSISVDCPCDEWQLVAENIKQGRIRPTLTNPSKYWYDVVPHGDPIPDLNMVSASNTLVFGQTWNFQYRAEVDIYIYAFDYDGRVDFDDDAPYLDVIISDDEGRTVDITDEGNLQVAVQENFESEDTLDEILAQLKIINLHLSLMTDMHISKTEVE